MVKEASRQAVDMTNEGWQSNQQGLSMHENSQSLIQLLPGTEFEAFVMAAARDCRQVEVRVAFLMRTGVKFVRSLLKHAPVDLVVSLYGHVTDERALEDLLQLLQKGTKNPLRVSIDRRTGAGFHGKVYVIHGRDGDATLIVGSNNLSSHGLSDPGELALATTLPSQDLFEHPVWQGWPCSDLPWSTTSEQWPLRTVLDTYRSKGERRRFVETFDSQVHTLVGLRTLNSREAAFVDSIVDEVSEEAVEDDRVRWTMYFRERWKRQFRIADAVQRYDLVIAGWSSENLLHVARCTSIWRGESHLKGQRGVILFVEEVQDAIPRKALPWRNSTHSEDWLLDQLG